MTHLPKRRPFLRYLQTLWWTLRANRGRLPPTTPTVTLTVIKRDKSHYRIHNVPAKYVDRFIEMHARWGQRVLVADEERATGSKPTGVAHD